MKKIKLLLIASMLLLLPIITLASSISSSELDKQIKDGNILSDSFTTNGECSTTKDKYNQEFTSYKRSECFLNNGNYQYFICQLNKSCLVSTTNTTTVSSGNQTTITQDDLNIPNKDKLDAFLLKVRALRKELKTDTKYTQLLVQIEDKLKTLGNKYKSNDTISKMVGYLGVGVQNIKNELLVNKDVDDFFCELIGNCEEDIDDKPLCTTDYKPVCAQPPMPKCPAGLSCTQVMPQIKTYSNSCSAGLDGASVLYTGECKKEEPKVSCPQYMPPNCNNNEEVYTVSKKVVNGCDVTEYACKVKEEPKVSCPQYMPPNCNNNEEVYTVSKKVVNGCDVTEYACKVKEIKEVKDYSKYPSGSWEPQEDMNKRYSCSGAVPIYAEVGPLNYVGYQDGAPGKNTVWRSLYTLSDSDRNSDAWKSCTWYCNMGTSWNGSRCVSTGNIRFSSTQYKIGENLGGTITTGGYPESYYVCMETPANPNNCSNGSNFSKISNNTDWILSGNTFTLRSNYTISSSFPTGQYTGYLAIAENGLVKDPHRTAQRHSFNLVPGNTSSNTTTSTATISLYVSGDTLRGEIYTNNPSNTWACMDSPGNNNCSNRSNWAKMPTPGWTQTSFGFALSNYNIAGSPRGVYTGYVSVDKNGSIGPRGSSSINY